MFVIHPDKYLLPDYKISPFRTTDISHHLQLPPDEYSDTYFAKRFAGRKFAYTRNGRSALLKALNHYRLRKDDVVTILTTTGNLYVSGCVTGEVEKICQWNREINDATKVILVVHEFGYPFQDLEQLKSYNIPIIEDVAYAFFSTDERNAIGNVGDFVIYSFPKMFPIQIGGLIVHDTQVQVEEEIWPHLEWPGYIRKVMSFYIRQEKEIISQRMEHYRGLSARFERFGIRERFIPEKGVVPGVFMFQAPDPDMDLKKLRDHCFDHGIQCAIFYNERSFFIPVHQRLTDPDLDYFAAVIQSYVK